MISSTSTWALRAARADELSRLVAIDDEACSLFTDVGRGVNLPAGHHAFTLAEQATWRDSLLAGRVVVAVPPDDEPIGFVSPGFIDGGAHLQQVSVRRSWMRRGIGTALVNVAVGWQPLALWLTTSADLEWNRPYYERLGFSCVSEDGCGPQLRKVLEDERRALPAPDQRVAMVRHPRDVDPTAKFVHGRVFLGSP